MKRNPPSLAAARSILLAASAGILVLGGCARTSQLADHGKQSAPGGSGSPGDSSGYLRAADSDKAMERAVQEAQRTIGQFIAALNSPKPGQTGFAVKKRCIEGHACEHLWLTKVRFDGRVLRGKVDNHPLEIKGLHLGKTVTVRPEEVSDWMYVENGRLVGGYTVRTYYRSLPAAKKEQFTKNTGFRVE